MLDVLVHTDDLNALYCTPTVDLLLRNSLPMLRKLMKTVMVNKNDSNWKDNMVIVCS